MPDPAFPPSADSSNWKTDPSLINSRREAFFILGLWCCCFFYTVTYCYLFGYLSHEPLPAEQALGPDIGHVVGPLEGFNRDPATLTMPLGLGIPDWVLWGIVVPWGACIAVSIIFCLFFFAEDDLGAEAAGSQVGEA